MDIDECGNLHSNTLPQTKLLGNQCVFYLRIKAMGPSPWQVLSGR